MKRFNMRVDTAFCDKVEKEAPAWGIKTVSAFIRFAISKFPYKDMERRWSDADMVAFAERWAGRKGNPPGVLEEPAKQMERELLQFKQDFLTSK